MTVNLVIKRKKQFTATSYWQNFCLIAAGKTILDCLNHIKRELDPDLAYRAECRSGICGTCALRVNGQPVLGCKCFLTPELLKNDYADRLDFGFEVQRPCVVVEPLVNQQVVADLWLDETTFWAELSKFEPWVHGDEQCKQTESAEQASAHDCTLCGICDAIEAEGSLKMQNGGLVRALAFYSKQDFKNLLGKYKIDSDKLKKAEELCPEKIKLGKLIGAAG